MCYKKKDDETVRLIDEGAKVTLCVDDSFALLLDSTWFWYTLAGCQENEEKMMRPNQMRTSKETR